MRLDKTLSILYGELINTPYISAFSSVTSNISRISSGCLFFLQNPHFLRPLTGGQTNLFKPAEVCRTIDMEFPRNAFRALPFYVFLPHELVLLLPSELIIGHFVYLFGMKKAPCRTAWCLMYFVILIIRYQTFFRRFASLDEVCNFLRRICRRSGFFVWPLSRQTAPSAH